MSAEQYRDRIGGVLGKIWETQLGKIQQASEVMAEAIARGGLVHMFGSGHSVLPVQDMFPRYGAYPGFRPLMDMRLMWTNVIGSGGAKGLLWLERREGYAQVLFENEPIRKGDVMLVFSHGGLNAVGIEVLTEAKKRGLATVAVTSMDNYGKREATHSSGKKLADVADIVIDNCTPAEDALVSVEGWKAPVAAGSTVAFITIAMSIIAEVAARLAKKGKTPPVFVSPNVLGIPPDQMNRVYTEYEEKLRRGEIG
ncbi:MAG TPA: SIS domain-containing protein [Candidatus Saccharimonadales bacterium]|nr:SIS domain-containing protein [Candidatus Saccharimonadales bacterium]